MPRIHAQGLGKAFSGQFVLRGVDLDVADGAFLALLGPSGCGKTTLLRLLAGLEQPDEGQLQFDDRQIAGPGIFVPPEARDLGMVFQSYALWPTMSVRANIEFGLKIQKLSRADRDARVAEMLDIVGLRSLADRRPHQLSGGQRQRVALARSLAMRPRLVLLDEPLANLDAHLRKSMLAEFRRLHSATGATFILVTHDQDEAMAVASQIAVMDRGGIEQVGTPEQLYRKPASPMVARFISHGLTIPVTVDRNDGHLCHVQLAGTRAAFPGIAPPGPGWLCLHGENLHVVSGQGDFAAQVMAQTFQNGRYLTHVLPHGIGLDTLSLSVDQPLAPGTMLAVAVRRGWVIPQRETGNPAQPLAARKMTHA